MPLVNLRYSKLYGRTSLRILLRKLEIKSESASFLRALQIYVGWIDFDPVESLLRRRAEVWPLLSEECAMILLNLRHKDRLQVLERLERDLIALQLVEVVLDGGHLERLLVEGMLSQNDPPRPFLARRIFLLPSLLLICRSFYRLVGHSFRLILGQHRGVSETEPGPLHRWWPNDLLFTLITHLAITAATLRHSRIIVILACFCLLFGFLFRCCMFSELKDVSLTIVRFRIFVAFCL